MIAQDFRYQLVFGRRQYEAILEGALFWDPTSFDVVLVSQPHAGMVEINEGTVDLQAQFQGSKHEAERRFAAAADMIESAYDDRRDVFSSWLLGEANKGLAVFMERFGPGAINTDFKIRVEADPDTVWDMLRRRGVDQPWAQPRRRRR